MSNSTISAAALQAAADHGVSVPVDPGAQYGVEVARHCTTEALIAALRERDIALAFTRADVLAAVRQGWKQRNTGNPVIALTTVLEALGMGAHVVSRDGHATLVDEPERTPLVVLRAMLAAYERAALEAETAYRRGDVDAFASHSEIADAAKYIRSTTALYLIFGSLDIREPEILADYKARLAGTRPLGAPPLATK